MKAKKKDQKTTKLCIVSLPWNQDVKLLHDGGDCILLDDGTKSANKMHEPPSTASKSSKEVAKKKSHASKKGSPATNASSKPPKVPAKRIHLLLPLHPKMILMKKLLAALLVAKRHKG